MAQGFFVKYNSTVMDSVDKISSSYQTQFANDIMSLATVSVTLYVLWKGCNDPAVPAQLSGFGIGLRRCFHL
uniref:Uncharacterized protein n=1 Tax=Escherichia coli TaxID=562 RepID=A0A2I7QHD9_ECOLX|nr:hypothetical protein [Escherichia coli]